VTTIHLTGEIKEDGTLHLELPADLPAGKVQVTIETLPQIPSLTDEEIAAFMQVEPLTGAEIVAAGLTGGWEHMGITDSVEWLREQRLKRHSKQDDE
jgi:hypothetical protein